MKIIICFLLILANSASAQLFQTGHRSAAFTDSSRNNRSIPAELFYPANTAGNYVPLATGTQKFPVIVFGHGFVIAYSSYTWLADSLVKNGYIVAFPTSEGSLSPSHESYGKDIAFLSSYLLTINDSANSFLYKRLIKRSAVAGHSMGGGASFLAAGYNPHINAIFNFAAAETNPSAKSAALQCNIPALIFAGSADCIVPDSNQATMYQNIPYPCKSFIDITNALHCHFANNDGTCVSGQFFSGCNNSTITAVTVFQKTISLIVPFLNYYLKDSCSNQQIFEDRLNSMSGINKLRICANDPFTCPAALLQFTFTGSGNWNIAANWENELIPPSILNAGAEIVINPAGNSSCILNIPQTIAAGSKLTIAQGKNLLVPGNLIIQ